MVKNLIVLSWSSRERPAGLRRRLGNGNRPERERGGHFFEPVHFSILLFGIVETYDVA
jgi:hypothetical protein